MLNTYTHLFIRSSLQITHSKSIERKVRTSQLKEDGVQKIECAHARMRTKNEKPKQNTEQAKLREE